MNWLCQTHLILVGPLYWTFDLFKTVGLVENNGTNLSPERIGIKNGTLVVETLYFFMTYMPERDQVEKRLNLILNVNQILTVISISQVFCFAHLVVSERCPRLKTYALRKLEQPTNSTGLFIAELDLGHSCNKRLNLGCRSSLRRESRKI